MAIQIKQKDALTLQDEVSFEFLSGLWTGKKPPFTKAIVIRNTNFSNDGKINYSNTAVLDVEAKQLENRRLQSGDIIIERSGGGPKQPVGRVVYFDKETSEIAHSFSNFTSAIRVKDKSAFDSKYVFYFLHNFYIEGNTDHLQRRTTGIRNLDFSSYKESIVFPLISVAEQKAIAQILTTVQEAIAEQEKLITKLKELKRSMMRHLFTKGTKGEKTKMTEVGEIPRTWSVCSAEELSTAITVGVVVRPASYYVSDGVPAFRSFNIGEDRINERDFVYFSKQDNDGPLKKSKLQSGDILVVRTGYPGTACVVPEKYIGANCIDLVIVRPNRGLIDSHYFSRFINSPFGKSQVLSEKKGLAQQHFNVGAAKRMRIPLPDINEQQDIVRVLDTLDSRIVSSQEKVMAYRSLFKALLHELMSGERQISTKL